MRYWPDAETMKLTDLSHTLFAGMPAESIDLSRVDTSNVGLMMDMFRGEEPECGHPFLLRYDARNG